MDGNKEHRSLFDIISTKLEKIIKNNVKFIVKFILIGLIVFISSGTIFFAIVNEISNKRNIYNEELKEIVLEKIDGDLIKVERELLITNFEYIYEFEIRDKNNIIQEISISGITGDIQGIEYEEKSRKK